MIWLLENCRQTKCMRQFHDRDRNQTDRFNLLASPASPKSTASIVQELMCSLNAAECRPGQNLAQFRCGSLCGLGRNRTNDWLHTEHAVQVRKYFCVLGNLSEIQQIRLLRTVCRDCPRVTHAKLAHDPLAVTLLFRILDQASGLTFVSGFSDEHRTFILTSLGNSATWNDARKRVNGLDVHTPDHFSPVPGIYYFAHPQTPE